MDYVYITSCHGHMSSLVVRVTRTLWSDHIFKISDHIFVQFVKLMNCLWSDDLTWEYLFVIIQGYAFNPKCCCWSLVGVFTWCEIVYDSMCNHEQATQDLLSTKICKNKLECSQIWLKFFKVLISMPLLLLRKSRTHNRKHGFSINSPVLLFTQVYYLIEDRY